MAKIGSEEENLDGFPSKFLPAKLSCRQPDNKARLWVFWSQEVGNHTSTYSDPSLLTNHDRKIQVRVRAALFAFDTSFFPEVLVQFWAPMTPTGGQCLLTTSHQPFALTNANGKLTRYRKECLSYNSAVEDFHNTDRDGPPGRVFRNQLPEFSRDVSYYSTEEYPLRDLALACGIWQMVALPVFDPSQQYCVGVLELLFPAHNFPSLNHYVGSANRALKVAGLKTTDTKEMRNQIQKGLCQVEEEIREALKQVCKKHSLPLACAWAKCRNDELLVSMPSMSVYEGEMYYDYRQASYSLPVRVDQGFLSDKPCLCRDVTKLSISEFPLAHCARKSGLTHSFPICLRGIGARNHEYAIEFFLSRGTPSRVDRNNMLFSILETLKRHLKSFEVVMDEMLNELFTEVSISKESFVEASKGKGESKNYNYIRSQEGQQKVLFTEVSILSESFVEASKGKDQSKNYNYSRSQEGKQKVLVSEVSISRESFVEASKGKCQSKNYNNSRSKEGKQKVRIRHKVLALMSSLCGIIRKDCA